MLTLSIDSVAEFPSTRDIGIELAVQGPRGLGHPPSVAISAVTGVPGHVGPQRRIDDDVSGVAGVSSPRRRVIVSFECVSQCVAGLPVAGTEPPDVCVEEVTGEVGPSSLAGDLGSEECGVARFESVGSARVRGKARRVSAGEEAQALHVHQALRSSRTCGDRIRFILSPVSREVKFAPAGAQRPGGRWQRFSEGVEVDDYGEWTGFYQRRAYGTGSPIEQNRKHIAVLNDVFAKRLVEPVKRLGFTINPSSSSPSAEQFFLHAVRRRLLGGAALERGG